MRSVLGGIAVFATLFAACEDPGPSAADAGPSAEAGQGDEARFDLVINEVAPQPDSGSDWIELFNRSPAPIDLCGFFLTDDLDRLDKYLPLGGAAPPDPCPPRLLGPGEYHLVWADGGAGAGPDHAPFKLGRADEVHLVTTAGLPVDSLVYLYPPGGRGASLARVPDGEGRFYLAPPTPGEENPVLP